MNTGTRLRRLAVLLLIARAAIAFGENGVPSTNTVRVAAAQAARRVVDFRLKPDEALAAVEMNLAELERIVDRAGEAKCDALVLPEDTPGLLNWVGANETLTREVLPKAVKRMLERLGGAAARHKMNLVVCSDFTESDGATYNTAFLLGRDGKEIGRYHKTCPTWSEAGVRQRGSSFPVFPTPDLGTVGMLICYDLVVPETARCLALAGADIIFFPTMGGAAIGDDDIGVQALRVRAAENFIWLVVAQRGSGAMIISPQGKIVAQAERPDGLAIADIDVHGQREGGDALNWQRDMRARLFRERNPEAFRILTDTNPPVLAKVPISLTQQEAGRIMARALTVGEDEFKQANELVGRGKTEEAITAFERLRKEYPATWIDRRSEERLAKLQPAALKKDASTSGLAAKYPGDVGIGRDPAVLFHDDFEAGDIGAKWDEVTRRKGRGASDDSNPVMAETDQSIARGTRAARVQLRRDGHEDVTLVKWLKPGFDELRMRYYVRYGKDYGYHGHGGGGFVADAGKSRSKGAGKAPDGDAFFWATLEPIGPRGWDPPGALIFYAYWWKMKPDGRGNHWGNWFQPKPDQVPKRETWTCVEWRVKANAAGSEDGELDCWINGTKCGEFRGINWRSVDTLKVNQVQLSLWLEADGYARAGGGLTRTIWYDDVVVARDYIGPIQK